MTDRLDFETRLEERLRARAALASRPFDAAAIAHQAAAGKRRRWWIGRFEVPTFRPVVGWLIVAMLLALAVSESWRASAGCASSSETLSRA